MGNRGQVLIRDTGVYLYTHCGRNSLITNVKDGLRNTTNWKDYGQLTSNIADKMYCDDISNHFIYNYLLVILDCKYEKVDIIEYPDTKSEKILAKGMSFTEFLDKGCETD